MSFAQSKAVILAELDRLQFGSTDKLILMRQAPIGLGGQITGRLDGLRVALALGRKAVFPRLDDPPYAQSFLSMNTTSGDFPRHEDSPDVDLFAEQVSPFVSLDPMRFSAHHGRNEERVLELIARRLSQPPLAGDLLNGIILEWLQLTPELKDYCELERSRLGVSDAALGVHFRRGDKAVETAFVPAAELNRRISLLYKKWRFTSIFLASDSPRAIEEINVPPGVKLIFDHEEKRYNNANHKMLIANPSLAKQETFVAMKNIYLLSACGGIVGQDNAHFATIAASRIAARQGNSDRIALVDGKFAEKNSPMLGQFFALKTAIRSLGRRLLPGLTAKRRLQRNQR